MTAIDRASIRAMHYAPSASALEIARAGIIHDNDRRQTVTGIARDFVINSANDPMSQARSMHFYANSAYLIVKVLP